MGLNDHLRTWRYTVNASPDDCFRAFAAAFSGGGLFYRAKWSVQRTNRGAEAVYKGRGGVAAVASVLSATSANEEQGAADSTVTFEIQPAGGRTECTMWLGNRGTKFGFTADARFIRPYMRKVEAKLRELDAGVGVERT